METSKTLTHEFHTPVLLEPGTVHLGIPVKDGAIQIGSDDLVARSKLLLRYDDEGMGICRLDGNSIQVEMDREYYDADNRLKLERIKLFKNPVESVMIQREMGSTVWKLLQHADTVTDEKSFWNFMSRTIGFAEIKQRQNPFQHK